MCVSNAGCDLFWCRGKKCQNGELNGNCQDFNGKCYDCYIVHKLDATKWKNLIKVLPLAFNESSMI